MPCHKRLKKGQQPAGIFQVFFLRVDVHILHGFQICPAAHALQRFFRYACAIGTCGEGVTEAMRCFAVDVDCCANALPQATICLKGERLMRIIAHVQQISVRSVHFLWRERENVPQLGKHQHVTKARFRFRIADDGFRFSNFHSTRVCKLCLFLFAQFIVPYPSVSMSSQRKPRTSSIRMPVQYNRAAIRR